jgi:two-component system, NarL family, nitrate/nitrite response regulator NarL
MGSEPTHLIIFKVVYGLSLSDKKIINIVVSDKSPLIQVGLRTLFGCDKRFALVATAVDGEQFMEEIGCIDFDIGIIGWEMPYLNGRGVLKKMANINGPTPKIIVYTSNVAPDVPRQVMRLGGAGFCQKSESPERLIETILAVSEGRMVFPFMDMSKPGNDPFGLLTGREQELLIALSEGNTNIQIASELDISLNTVKFHLKNLYSKLNVKNRAQAVASYLKEYTTV